MMSEMMASIIVAFLGAIATGIVTFFLDRRKERREDKREKEKDKKEIYDNRPELEIIDYKNYICRPGFGIRNEYDINIFMTKIGSVSVDYETVEVHYNKDYFNEEEWCCVVYTFRNIGKTDIQCINPICVYKKDTILCSVSVAQEVLKHGLLSYGVWYDHKIRVGEVFTMKICYHTECIMTGMISSNMIMGIEDCNKRCWIQPLFAPYNKIYDTCRVSKEEYKELLLPDKAIECFKKPWLW